MGNNERNTLILVGLIIVVLIVGYYFLLFSPQRQEISERREERSTKESQLQQLQQEVANLEDLQARAPDIERQLLQLGELIPDNPEIPTLVVQLQQIAAAANVTQVSIQPEDPQPPAEGGDFTVIPVTMSFEGTYGELQNFLLRLQNLARLVTVSGLTYGEVEQQGEETTGGQENVENLLQIEVVAEVYAQPSGSATPSATPAAAGPPASPGGGGETTSGGGG